MGKEHEVQTSKIAETFGVTSDTLFSSEPNLDILKEIVAKPYHLIPETMEGTGPFPEKQDQKWDVSKFETPENAYHQLMLDLTCMLRASIMIAAEGNVPPKLYMDGGFVDNKLFIAILASLFPDRYIVTSELKHASALLFHS